MARAPFPRFSDSSLRHFFEDRPAAISTVNRHSMGCDGRLWHHGSRGDNGQFSLWWLSEMGRAAPKKCFVFFWPGEFSQRTDEFPFTFRINLVLWFLPLNRQPPCLVTWDPSAPKFLHRQFTIFSHNWNPNPKMAHFWAVRTVHSKRPEDLWTLCVPKIPTKPCFDVIAIATAVRLGQSLTVPFFPWPTGLAVPPSQDATDSCYPCCLMQGLQRLITFISHFLV